MLINLPELSLVVLVGASGSGQVDLRAPALPPTEILSSDYCRGLVSDSEIDQSCSRRRLRRAALHRWQAPRPRAAHRGRRHQRAARRPSPSWVDARPRVPRPPRRHRAAGAAARLRRTQRPAPRPQLRARGLSPRLTSCRTDEVDGAEVRRTPLWNDRSDDQADPSTSSATSTAAPTSSKHYCSLLGYAHTGPRRRCLVAHPSRAGGLPRRPRRPRAARSPASCALVMDMVRAGSALCVPGNHEAKLMRGAARQEGQRSPTASPSRSSSSAAKSDERRLRRARRSSTGSSAHYVLDDGRLVVAHAGLKEEMQGRGSRRCASSRSTARPRARPTSSACPCATTGRDYRGRAMVVYGHTPVPRGRVAERHDQHRHRLRVRRQAHRAALPRARARLRARRSRRTTSRSGRCLPRAAELRRRPAAAARRGARPRRRDRQALSSDAPPAGNVTIARRTPAAALEVMSRFASTRAG
jgi:protein phosphatase